MMPKYVVLTDTHLGQNGEDKKGHYSLLSPKCINHRFKNLKDGIKRFTAGDRYTLVLGGDIVDLSLARPDVALDEFHWLLSHLQPDDCTYVVGNHDHHIYMMHREYSEIIEPLRGREPINYPIYRPMSMVGNESFIMHEANRRIHRGHLKIAYPAVMLERSIIVTHGHLSGGMYSLLSRMLEPYTKRYDQETLSTMVNMPIIEFVYWLLGQAGGGFGVDGIMEVVYTDLQKGDDSFVAELISRAIDVLLPDGLIRGIPDKWERNIVKWGARRMVNTFVTQKQTLSSSDRHKKGGAAYRQVRKWVEEVYPQPLCADIVIHGHTHVAYEAGDNDVRYYNPGSWLVEPGYEDPDSYAVFIDTSDQHSRPQATIDKF